MATQAEVRRIAMTFPGTVEDPERFAFAVSNGAKLKGYAWVWLERVNPKKPRVANPDVLAVRVANLDAKEMLLMAEPEKFFTEPHYDGFAAVLVRLAKVSRSEMRELLRAAWNTQAPTAAGAAKKPAVRSATAARRRKRPAG